MIRRRFLLVLLFLSWVGGGILAVFGLLVLAQQISGDAGTSLVGLGLAAAHRTAGHCWRLAISSAALSRR
jgi:hypothetical protein